MVGEGRGAGLQAKKVCQELLMTCSQFCPQGEPTVVENFKFVVVFGVIVAPPVW